MKYEDIIYYERQDAAKSAKIEDICELLEEYGPIPKEIMDRLSGEKDITVLAKLHKMAAKAVSLEEFIQNME